MTAREEITGGGRMGGSMSSLESCVSVGEACTGAGGGSHHRNVARPSKQDLEDLFEEVRRESSKLIIYA